MSELNSHYLQLQSRWNVVSKVDQYSKLVTATDNAEEPFHRWFPFKEAFSHRLLATLLSEHDVETPDGFFDPFAGSGTSLLSAANQSPRSTASVTGWEVNPMIATIARAKLAASIAARSFAGDLATLGKEVVSAVPRYQKTHRLVGLSTLNNTDYLPSASLQTLLAISAAIDDLAADSIADILKTALAATVEPSIKLRRDGRALRYVPTKPLVEPLAEFASQVSEFVGDIREHSSEGSTLVEVANRSALGGEAPPGFALSLFSPPYPNNIDYTEVYKTESWVAGFYDDSDAMRQQRLATLRSHPSVKFPEDYAFSGAEHSSEITELVKPLARAVPDGRYRAQRLRTVNGYVDDMNAVLNQLASSIQPGGDVFCVVANSKHGHGEDSFEIASDLLIAGLAELQGFEVQQLEVARYPSRRLSTTGFLRETVVHLKR